MSKSFPANADEQPPYHWEWPELDSPKGAITTALNQVQPTLEPEPIEEETAPAPVLPTLEEIETIREEAYQDGFAEGREAGESKGFEQGRLKGLEQGYNEGYQQGIEQGLEAGQEQITERLTRWDQLLNEFIHPLQALDEQVERELITLAMRLAQAVVQVELRTSSAAILEALRLGVQALPSQRQQVEIQLNEQDKDLVQNSFGEAALAQRQWQLVLEPGLSAGSLLLTCERSQVAMLGDERLQKVLQHFSSRPRSEVDEPAYPYYSSEQPSEVEQTNEHETQAEPPSECIDPSAALVTKADPPIDPHSVEGEYDHPDPQQAPA